MLANMIAEPIVLLSGSDVECKNIVGNLTSLAINTTKEWRLTAPSWIEVSPSSGIAGITWIRLTVSSLLNADEQKRAGVIKIRQDGDTKEVHFHQRALSQQEALKKLDAHLIYYLQKTCSLERSKMVTIERGDVVAIDFSTRKLCSFFHGDVVAISGLLATFSKIRTLHLPNCDLNGDINVLLSRLSTYNRELVSLILDNNSFDKATYITPDLAKLDKLTYLSLKGCNITCKIPRLTCDSTKEEGAVYTLQRAKKGKGVNLVILGDGFTCVDMASGGYFEEIADRVMEAFFDIEPTKSFKEYFDVYMVKSISKQRGIGEGKNTSFSTKRHRDKLLYGDYKRCIEYAQMAPVSDTALTVITICNSSDDFGACFDLDGGDSVSFCSIIDKKSDFDNTIRHESIGHGLGKLSDEYVNARLAPTKKELREADLGVNVDITPDRNRVKWSKFLSLSQYSDSVGIFEGGYYLKKGVWRASENSIMNNMSSEFNAPSRYQIISNIMRYAGESYSFEQFLEYDKINL